MPNNRPHFENNRLWAGGKPVDLWSGAFHYWRHDPGQWPMFFERIAEMGFRMVETYVPWSVHERAPGEFDFGEIDRRLNLGAWIDLAATMGFTVLIRPGPHINSELTFFGFPERLWSDTDLWSRDPHGNAVILPAPPRAFPVLSYAHPKLFDEYQPFLERVAELLKPRLAPAGPVIGLQSDNENSYFFRTGAYDQDYSRAGRAYYHQWLRKRYGSELPAAYPMGNIDLLPPPHRFEPAPGASLDYHLDWVRCKEDLLVDSHRRLRERWAAAGIDDQVFWFHNYPPFDPALPPFHVADMERGPVDVQAIDFYETKEDTAFVCKAMAYLAGTSRLPYVAEFGAGSTLWIKPLQPEDEKYIIPLAAAMGMRAANFYMLVDRDRWFGAPISRTGRPMETFGFFQAFLKFVREAKLSDARPEVELTVVMPRDTLRLEHAANLFSVITPLVYGALGVSAHEMSAGEKLGFARAPHAAFRDGLDLAVNALNAAQIPFHLADTECDPALLKQNVLVVAGEALSEGDRRRIAAWQDAGKNVCWFAKFPSLDFDGRPFALQLGGEVCADPSRLVVPQVTSALPVFVRAHAVPEGRILFAVNPTAQACAPRIEGAALGERLWGEGTPQELPAHSVTVWRIA